MPQNYKNILDEQYPKDNSNSPQKKGRDEENRVFRDVHNVYTNCFRAISKALLEIFFLSEFIL